MNLVRVRFVYFTVVTLVFKKAFLAFAWIFSNKANLPSDVIAVELVVDVIDVEGVEVGDEVGVEGVEVDVEGVEGGVAVFCIDGFGLDDSEGFDNEEPGEVGGAGVDSLGGFFVVFLLGFIAFIRFLVLRLLKIF